MIVLNKSAGYTIVDLCKEEGPEAPWVVNPHRYDNTLKDQAVTYRVT